jgi:hypothetical protein
MLAVILVAAVRRRDRPALAMGLVAAGSAALAALAWLLVVALPNWERLRTALRVWPRVDYLDDPLGIAGRLWRHLADSDGAVGRSLPLLLAAAVGLVVLAVRWRRLQPPARDTLVMAAAWGVGLWLVVAAGDYLPGHYLAPNRYAVPALPGLAVLAGFGLAFVAYRVGGDTGIAAGQRRAAVAGVALGLAVAIPGVATYLDGALRSGRTREADQRTLAAAVSEDAVVYGAYAPTLLFDTRLATLTPWPSADANVRDPVRRLGVTHVLVGNGPADPTGRVPTIVEQGAITLLARVPWGDQELALYALAPRADVDVSPTVPSSGYDPLADRSRRT